VFDFIDLRHNHAPQSLESYNKRKSRQLTMEQLNFVHAYFSQNQKANGAQIRKAYRQLNPGGTDMFQKKVQNIL